MSYWHGGEPPGADPHAEWCGRGAAYARSPMPIKLAVDAQPFAGREPSDDVEPEP